MASIEKDVLRMDFGFRNRLAFDFETFLLFILSCFYFFALLRDLHAKPNNNSVPIRIREARARNNVIRKAEWVVNIN